MNLFNKIIIAGLAIISFSCDKENDTNTSAKAISTVGITTATPKKFLFDATKA
jgi:hypothetical protein